jgi:hypothetical protein
VFESQTYVPVLKGKDAEFKALRDIAPAVKERILPLIEVMPEGFSDAKNGTRRSVDTHLAKTHARIVKCWGTTAPLFVDFLIERGRVVGQKTVARRVFDDLRADGVKFIPVTTLDAPLTYQDEVRTALQHTGQGACVRVGYRDFDPRTLPARFEDLRKFLGVGYASMDVVIDLREVTDDQVPPMVLAARAVLASLPGLEELRSVTLAGSSFPKHLGGCKPDSLNTMPRAEWRLWNEVASTSGGKRIPMYGDYAIANPEYTEFDPKTMRVSAQMRYTADTEYIVAKGRALGFGAPDQTVTLCGWIVARKEFRGARFSPGDDYIAKRAARAATPGNPSTWRWAGTTHHLTFAQQQVATVLGP